MLPPWAYTAETPSGPDGVYQTEMTKSLNRAFFNTSGRTFHAGLGQRFLWKAGTVVSSLGADVFVLQELMCFPQTRALVPTGPMDFLASQMKLAECAAYICINMWEEKQVVFLFLVVLEGHL